MEAFVANLLWTGCQHQCSARVSSYKQIMTCLWTNLCGGMIAGLTASIGQLPCCQRLLKNPSTTMAVEALA